MEINSKNPSENNLKIMNAQTQQWIMDIEFYEEELIFFRSIISRRINSTTPKDLKHKVIYRNIDIVLCQLSEDLLKQVKMHAKELSKFIYTNGISNHQESSKAHLHLLQKIA